MDMNACGVSSRRFACDRCRGQKLRCIRERTDQQNCDRFFRADAECRTSPVFHARSCLGDTASASTKSIGGKARVQKSVRKRRYNNVAQLQMQSQVTTQQAVIDTAIVTEIASSSGSLGHTALMNIFETSQSSLPVPMDSTGFSDTTSDMHWAAEDSLFSGLILPDGTDQTFDLSGNSGAGNSTESYPSQAPTYTGDLPSRPTSSLILSARTASSTSTSNLQNIECSSQKKLATISEINTSYENPEDQVEGSISIDKNEEETIVQRVAKTNLDLVSLLCRIDKGTPTAMVEMLVEPIDETKSPRTRLDDILNITRDFLQALSLLAGSSGRPSASSFRSSSGTVLSPNPTSNTTRPDLQKGNKDYADTASGTDESSTSSPVDSCSTSIHSTLSNYDSQTYSKYDFATSLLILTCHHKMKSILVYSDADFPESGNLQTTILLQIITSLFEQIERLLGLPREYRMDPGEIGPDGFASGGLLSSEEMFGIVEFAFQQRDSGQSESRRGGLKVLREHLEGIKQLLKNSIAP
ncbi:hypothetical protein BHYA_0028g00130 [Botrytis hyacinthi]|uniref:Zn(2)-C6 fungal-type domain-containing protein n=1 Tax=Botrytis hyacinthi TaxID=278943 RepID=A0A4Z1H018_9HELO|nr:hypothetical protein BHYA_0028g00130 [Botrytis hyacinthi]